MKQSQSAPSGTTSKFDPKINTYYDAVKQLIIQSYREKTKRLEFITRT